MTERQRDIFNKIAELKDRLGDFRCEMDLLRNACGKLTEERDAAIQRAEKAERDFKALCRQTDQRENEVSDQFTLLADNYTETKKVQSKYYVALQKIAHIGANRFPDNSTWKDLTSEAIKIARDAIANIEEPIDSGTLTIKKA